MGKEALLIAIAAIWIVVVYFVMDVIRKYSKAFPVSRSQKAYLVYITILFPLIGFLLTRPMVKQLKK